MLYFRTRTDARNFATKQDHYTLVDCGKDADKDGRSILGAMNRRWAVRVLK